jgi:uncharacterized RDD family membrane protein YckC
MLILLALVLEYILGLRGLGWGLSFIIIFACTWFYGGLFETFWNGQTPGKRLMRIRVLSTDGQAINASQAVLRNVLRAVDMAPGLYLVGLIAAAMNKRFQRLGDLAAGTMVIVEEPHWLRDVATVREPEVVRLTAQIPPWFQPDRSMARALALYVGRRTYFSPSRRLQIARYIGVPMREKFQLPQQTHLDHLLCAMYNRAFVTDGEEEPIADAMEAVVADDPTAISPFAPTASPVEEGA